MISFELVSLCAARPSTEFRADEAQIRPPDKEVSIGERIRRRESPWSQILVCQFFLVGRMERKTLTQFGDTHEKYAIIIPLDIERTIEARCGSWVGCPSSTCPRLAFTFVRLVASGC